MVPSIHHSSKLLLNETSFINKNGVLWSQTRMRIEMRLRCFFGHLVIGNLYLVFYLECSGML